MSLSSGIEQGTAQVISKTPKKGPEFEDECYPHLEKLTSDEHDRLQDVRFKPGIGGKKAGDFVVILSDGTLNGEPEKKFAIELKNEELKIDKILDILDSALACREANYAIHIARYKEQIPDVGWFNEYQGNKLVCAIGREVSSDEMLLGIINVAYSWAKMRVKLETAKKTKGVDVTSVQNRVDSVIEKLEDFETIMNQADKIERGAVKIQKVSKILEKSIRTEINEIALSIT